MSCPVFSSPPLCLFALFALVNIGKSSPGQHQALVTVALDWHWTGTGLALLGTQFGTERTRKHSHASSNRRRTYNDKSNFMREKLRKQGGWEMRVKDKSATIYI
ncbi:hypothetical protein EAF00_006286 [Botryotinia globosa]|nr:hypothetical protein EAF00_006286 [Botryotinia globosa]